MKSSSLEKVSNTKTSDVAEDTSRPADYSAAVKQASTTGIDPTTGSTNAEVKPQSKTDDSKVPQTATGVQSDAKSKMKTTNGDEKGEELKSSKGMSDFTI